MKSLTEPSFENSEADATTSNARVIGAATLLGAITLLLSLLLSAPAWSQEEVTDLRYRSSLESVLANQQMVVRVSELERGATAKRVAVLFFDEGGRLLSREFGRVSPSRPLEVILPVGALGSRDRELVRVEVRVLGVEEINVPLINVDIYDPLDLVWGDGWVCSGPSAAGRGPIGDCKGIVDLVPRQ